MSWQPGGEFALMDRAGNLVRPADLDVTWWRRLPRDVVTDVEIPDAAARDVITRDCRATIIGGFATSFTGRWVSHPAKTDAASNKLIQLQAAANVGLRLPETLISQDPAEIRKFYEHLRGNVIVKTVAGTKLTPLLTGILTHELLDAEDSLTVAPAIYQQLIEGDRHLRVCVFGDRALAGRLISSRLDWRYPLDVESEAVEIDEALARKLRALLRALDLRMGIFDLKETDEGEPVFLEVNPQGQFLFLEGLCGLPLSSAFAEFLKSELVASHSSA
jgi:glutathione synthase/RimK-type ligase-like ATP-grasp enzyme